MMVVRLGMSAHFGSAGILPDRIERSLGCEFARKECFALSRSAGKMPAETGWKPVLPQLKK